MAPDVIDLISSSPPPPQKPTTSRGSPHAVVLKSPLRAVTVSHSTGSAAVSKPQPCFPSPVDVEIISDDWISSSIHLTEGGRQEQRHDRDDRARSRRQRTSSLSSVDGLAQAKTGHQIRSDLLPVLPVAPLAEPSKHLVLLSSDPFASSPPKTTKLFTDRSNTRGKQIADLISSDPFASSPPRRQLPTTIPKANPPPARFIQRTDTCSRETRTSKPKVAAWDPIPTSTPDLPHSGDPEGDDQTANLTPRPAVMSIIDSDSDGALPDIADFDLSQPEPLQYLTNYLSRQGREIPATTRTAADVAKQGKTVTQPQQSQSRKREAAPTHKEAEREAKRRQRELDKEQKKLDKERAAAVAEVNKARSDRKISTMEMIVDLPPSLDSGLMVQLDALFDGISVEHHVSPASTHDLIRWRRKVNSRLDEDSGQWVPAPMQVTDEEHVVRVMTADELVSLATRGDELDLQMTNMRQHSTCHQVIIILEGVTGWMRKNRSIRNRQFTSGVRSQEEVATEDAAPTRRRNNARAREYVSEDVIEDAMLRLQVEHEVLIHHTAVPLETAQWIVAFTQHISTIPYKRQRDDATAVARFCMDSGQVRTGDDAHDTYIRMLQEIFRITAPIAYGIAGEYSSVSKLVRGLESGGPGTLDSIRKSANKDGAFSDRTIGQAVSKRLYKIFTGRDEASTEV